MDNSNNNENNRNRYERVGARVSIFLCGRIWHVNYVDNDGKQRRPSLRTRSKKETRLRALRIESELECGESRSKPKAVELSDSIQAYDDYLVAEGRAPKTLSRYRIVLQRVKELAATRGIKRGHQFGVCRRISQTTSGAGGGPEDCAC